jgi:ABC-type transport system involved in multi-copper enzyme maturation permease subunit
MVGFNFKSVYTIAKKEFMDNIRSKWIIAISIIFIILTILSSIVAHGQGEFAGMGDTVVTILTISTLLIPIIAIMLGFSTIAGEAEKGALYVVLSYPVRRVEVLLGKFFGLGSVLAVTPLIGFGIGGIVIAATVGAEEGVAYLAFIGLTILLGIVYLSAIIFISALCKTRVRAIAGGVILFFWAMIYGLIIFSIYIATGGEYKDFLSPTGLSTLPDWFWGSVVFSPGDLNQMTVMRAFDINQAFGFQIEAPNWLNIPFLLVVQMIWILVPLILAYFVFNRRDI